MKTLGHGPLWAFSISFTLLLLALVEAVLRISGHVPGDVSPRWANFRKVDTLKVTDEFLADSNGIMYANPQMAEVWNRPLNEDGFPFIAPKDSTLPRVMLIGDSFVWGMTVSHADSSFANIIHLETGWQVHNFGIPATDPVQYALVAEHHLPQVRPDAVLVFFFMGNDVMFHERPVRPYRPQFVATNAGAIFLDIEGTAFADVHEAYSHLLHGRYFISDDNNLLEWVVARSALLSRIYAIRFRVEEKVRWERGIRDLSISNRSLLRIKQVAERSGAEFRIIVIPERKEADMAPHRYESRYGSMLRHPDLAPHIHWPQTDKDMFVPYPDAHLNNRGHRAYAEFIKGLLEELQD